MGSKKNTSQGWNIQNTYTALPPELYAFVSPEPSPQPDLKLFNQNLATALGLIPSAASIAEWTQCLSGKTLPPGSQPFAQAYAGHQFGHFTVLGDGRAVMLGEQVTPKGERFDLQWKGSGPTPYSRGGDGRATLSAMLREYLMSESLHALGIPTTRSLALLLTGHAVHRNGPQTGAMLVRVAQSHIRVGTFEFVARTTSAKTQQAFLSYVLQRHFPQHVQSQTPAANLLQEVMHRQIRLICHWLRCGFIHGVMNTDNMSIVGETIDFGPCAFMNRYHPGTVFSSIDHNGRYAFGKQPEIAHWNLSVLAASLLPMWHRPLPEAHEEATHMLNTFQSEFQTQRNQMLARKTGNPKPPTQNWTKEMAHLLDIMQQERLDFTETFASLLQPASPHTNPAFLAWRHNWEQHLAQEGISMQQARETMARENPLHIPRNHWVESALNQATEQGQFAPFNTLLEGLSSPYTPTEWLPDMPVPPEEWDRGYYTFCGT